MREACGGSSSHHASRITFPVFARVDRPSVEPEKAGVRILPLVVVVVVIMNSLFQHDSRAADVTSSSRQLLVVTVPTWNSTTGRLERFERDDIGGTWRKAGAAIPVSIGRSGLAWGAGRHVVPAKTDGGVKKEGDGRSPAGIFSLMNAFGYAPSNGMAGLKIAYEQCTESLRCVDDAASPDYNRILAEPKGGAPWKSAEVMRRDDEQYRLGVVVAHNQSPRVAGGGSCIFLHIWSAPGAPTSGCTAMKAADLEVVVRWLDAAKEPLLVQWTDGEAAGLDREWKVGLPK